MKPFEIFLVSTYLTNFSVGFIGNILVIIYLYDSLNKLNHINKALASILFNLALADILTEIFGIVSILFEYEVVEHPEGVLGDVVCKILTSHTLTWTFTNVSVMTVVLLAWERYRAVTQFKSKVASDVGETKYINYIIGTFWIVGPAMYSPFVPFQRYDENEGCTESFPNKGTKYTVTLIDFTCFYVVPCIFFIYAYTSIVRSLKKPPKYMSDRRKRQFAYGKVRRQLTRTALLIVGGYFLCWSSAYIIYTVQVLCDLDTSAINMAYEISLIPAYFASTSHPIIYSFRSKQFRNTIREYLGKLNHQNCWLRIISCCPAAKIEPASQPYVITTTEETKSIQEHCDCKVNSSKEEAEDMESKCKTLFEKTEQ